MENILSGKKVAITGTFCIPRRDLINLLERVANISGETNISQADYLLVGTLTRGSSATAKITSAQSRGIPMISEEKVKAIIEAIESQSEHIEAYNSTVKPSREEYLASCPETYGEW